MKCVQQEHCLWLTSTRFPSLQVDYLMSRLSALKGRIAGIEDQLNIEMDHRCVETLPEDAKLWLAESTERRIWVVNRELFRESIRYDCCRRNELQALDLAITAFMSSLAFISMIGAFVWSLHSRVLETAE